MIETLRRQKIREEKSKRLIELAKRDKKSVGDFSNKKSSFKDEEKTFSFSYMN